jgi:hypothetical protein
MIAKAMKGSLPKNIKKPEDDPEAEKYPEAENCGRLLIDATSRIFLFPAKL